MKYLVSVIAFILVSCSTIDTRQVPEEWKNHAETIELKGLNSSEIYDYMRVWFVVNFMDANSVIQYENKDQTMFAGEFISRPKAKGMSRREQGFLVSKSTSGYQYNFNVKQSVEVYCKDNKLRVVFGNALLPSVDKTSYVFKPDYDEAQAIKKYWEETTNRIKLYLEKKKSQSNW